jgi:hypothetical protein
MIDIAKENSTVQNTSHTSICSGEFLISNCGSKASLRKTFSCKYSISVRSGKKRCRQHMNAVISIEKALNSRCSSDSGPTKSHFGTFKKKDPSKKVMDLVVKCLNVPQFSGRKLLCLFENRHLVSGFENSENDYTQRLLHIESGMQQQAVYLACSAIGMGTCIHNLGVNGAQDRDRTLTAKHLIMEMEIPYSSGKFSTRTPGPQKPYVLGKNLVAPIRDGEVECLAELPRLNSSKKSGSSATSSDVSQLLWAARGRTPHCIKIQKWKYMWGLTIPTWGGIQDWTGVYLLEDKKLYKYINWTKSFSLVNRIFREKLKWTRGNPTHDIRFVRNVNISPQMNGHNRAILICRNEHVGAALWEVGYMLENLFLQARSLGIWYESKIFSVDEESLLNEQGVPNAMASIFI